MIKENITTEQSRYQSMGSSAVQWGRRRGLRGALLLLARFVAPFLLLGSEIPRG